MSAINKVFDKLAEMTEQCVDPEEAAEYKKIEHWLRLLEAKDAIAGAQVIKKYCSGREFCTKECIFHSSSFEDDRVCCLQAEPVDWVIPDILAKED